MDRRGSVMDLETKCETHEPEKGSLATVGFLVTIALLFYGIGICILAAMLG